MLSLLDNTILFILYLKKLFAFCGACSHLIFFTKFAKQFFIILTSFHSLNENAQKLHQLTALSPKNKKHHQISISKKQEGK